MREYYVQKIKIRVKTKWEYSEATFKKKMLINKAATQNQREINESFYEKKNKLNKA